MFYISCKINITYEFTINFIVLRNLNLNNNIYLLDYTVFTLFLSDLGWNFIQDAPSS